MKQLKTLCLFFFSINLFSQTCLPSGITFTTQQQIDDFATDYVGCTEVLGGVEINESTAGDIVNLNGLSQITNLGSFLVIRQNTAITDLSGLDNIISIDGGIEISNNSNLINLNGLQNLTSTGGELIVASSNSLVNLTGLDNITSTGGRLLLIANDVLNDISALNNVTSVGGNLWLVGNPLLSSLQSFETLTSINGMLRITGHSSLTSLQGLENIAPNTFTEIIIFGNDVLSMCDVQSICDALDMGVGASFSGNTTGCNSVTEVVTACSTVPLSWGKIDIRKKDNKNEITWSVFNQVNNEKFEVEYRPESGLFVKLGDVKGHGTFLPEKKYSFIHENTPVGLSYYRIKQIDFDGNFSYSDIVSLHQQNTSTFEIYPNPSHDGVFYIDVIHEMLYTLYSSDKRVVLQGNFQSGDNTLDISTLHSGMYFLKTEFGITKVIKM